MILAFESVGEIFKSDHTNGSLGHYFPMVLYLQFSA